MKLCEHKRYIVNVKYDKKRLRRLVVANLEALGLIHDLKIQCRLSNTEVEYNVLVWVDGVRHEYRFTQYWSTLSVAQALLELSNAVINQR